MGILELIRNRSVNRVVLFLCPVFCTCFKAFLLVWNGLFALPVLICFVLSVYCFSYFNFYEYNEKVTATKEIRIARGLLTAGAAAQVLVSVMQRQFSDGGYYWWTNPYAGLMFLPLASVILSFKSSRTMCHSASLYLPFEILHILFFRFGVPDFSSMLIYGIEYLSGILLIAASILSAIYLVRGKTV